MKDRDIKSIHRIIEHIGLINEYMLDINSFEGFSNSQIVIDAVVFNLSQIGEIAKSRISSQAKVELTDIPWHDIYGFRNRIIHDYDDIDMIIVYDTVVEDLPQLLDRLVSIVNENN